MNTRTLATAIVAVSLAVSAAATFAGPPFGRDSVYAAQSPSASRTTSSATFKNDAQPNGRDTVSASRIPGSGQSVPTAEVTFRPGRA